MASREAAVRVGELIAIAGAVLVCGGLGGVMEAAALGAKKAGGLTIGILPGGSTAEANPSIDVPVATGIGYARNAIVALNADALIAIDGEYGTLSEIAYGIIYGKTVVGLGTWDIRGVIPARTPGGGGPAGPRGADRDRRVACRRRPPGRRPRRPTS